MATVTAEVAPPAPEGALTITAPLDRRIALGSALAELLGEPPAELTVDAELQSGRLVIEGARVVDYGGQALDGDRLDRLVYEYAPRQRSGLGSAEDFAITETLAASSRSGSARQIQLVMRAERCDVEAGDWLDPEGVGIARYPNEIDPDAAIAACRAAVARSPEMGRFHYQLGRALQAGLNYDEARAAFERARDLGHTRAWHALGDLAAEMASIHGGQADGPVSVSDEMPGVRVPYEAFMNSVGVLPGQEEVEAWLARESELASMGGVALPPQPVGALPTAICGPDGSAREQCLRTIPPRENGGNMDVQQMQVGTTLLLPCFIEGCGLFVGDVHFAQGDGEVSGTAIEMGAVVTLQTELRKGEGSVISGPEVEGGSQIKDIEPSKFYQTIGLPLKTAGEVPVQHTCLESEKIEGLGNLSEDLTLAARDALIRMIDYIERAHGLTREQAYILASVAVDLRVGQVVDVPNYVVTAVLNEDVFGE